MSTAPAAPNERRRAPRVESQLLVKFRVVTDPPGQWHMTPLKDMSTGGLRFAAEVPCDPGTRLELQLLLPTAAAPLHVTGHVQWTKPAAIKRLFEYGVELTDLQPAQRAELDRIVTLYRGRKQPAT